MARRRSLNRRWSRKSLNATELDQDSEFFDEDNPVWWKNLTDASTTRPSAQTSFAETTLPNLTPDSLVNDSELHDRWWDNLDRTSLQSSRRFSTRKSVNPGEVAPESFVSEGDDDVSIKKRKILLRARAKRSVGTENFLKAFDDSDVAHSEPVPSKKRKTQSPARSEADLIQRKSRTRHSRSLAERRDSSLNTSNDTDIVIKARPKAFKKRATQVSSDVYDEILTNAGPSAINTSKNASRINTPEKTIDSNESGFMGPPITGSHRKRLSTISKKLDMTSDESDGNAGTIKSRNDFQLKSKDNASFNPFDEILSGQLNESTASNKSSRSSNAATRMSKSLRQNPLLQVPVREDEERETKEASSESQLRETGEQQTLSDEEKDHRSSSALKEDSRVSKSRRNEEDGNEGRMDEWNVPETQEDPSGAVKIKKNSTMIEESVIDENSPESQNRDRRSSSVIKENARHSKRRTRDATSELNVPETQEDANLSTKRIQHSTMIEETADIDTQSQDRDRRSSVLKKHSGDSRRHTKDATNESNVPETQEDTSLSTRRIKNSTMIEESVEIDKESQDRDRRSSVVKKHSGDSRRHTKDRTSEWNVPETQEHSRKSTRSTTNSVMIEESIEIDQLPESQDHRSSSVLKKHSGDSRRHTKDRTSEWNVPETQEHSRKSTRSTTNTVMIEESIEIDQLPESQDHRSSSVLKKHSGDSRRHTKDRTSEWNVPETQEHSRKSTRSTTNSVMIEESIEIDQLPESQDHRSSSVLKKHSGDSRRHTKDRTSEWNVPETQEHSRKSTRSTTNSVMIEESIEIDQLPESQDHRSSSVLKKHSADPRRHTKDGTSEWNVPETQEHSRKSTRSTTNSAMIEESIEIDQLPESQDHRSSSVLKKHSAAFIRRTGDATIEKTATSEWEVQEAQENFRLSSRRMEKSTEVEEPVDIDKLTESQKVERRSSVLKRNSRLSQKNTRDTTTEEVPETQEDSRISIRPTKNSTIIGGSMEIDTLPESQGIDRRSSSVLKDNLKVSKRRTRDANIEEAAGGEWELPETQEDSRISIRPVKNSTMIEESMELDKLPETHDRDRRSSSVSKKSLRVSKRRTREATIDEATIEDDELPSFDEKSAKFTSTLKQNVREPKRRTKSMTPKVQSPEHEKLAEKMRSQLFEHWESSASEEEDKAIKSHERSHDSHNSSLITKTLAVSISRLPSPTSSHSRNAKEFKETTEESEEDKKSPIKRRSFWSRSRNLVDSAYELPDKDRSVSPVISASEDEAINKNSSPNTSTRKSSKNRQEDDRSARQSVNRSISDSSRRNRANLNVSLSRDDPAADLGESDLKFGPEKSIKSREHLFAENKSMSTKGIANPSNSQQEGSDQSISEELVIGSQRSNLNLSKKRSRSQRKANDSEGTESFAQNDSESHQSHKPNWTSPRKSSRLEKQIEPTKSAEPTQASQGNLSFAESISEAETEIADNEPSETNLESLRTEKRSDKSRKSSIRPNVSGKREESGESISEEEFNSKSLNQSSKDKSRASRNISGRLNVSRQRIESDESISEEESNLKSLNQSLKDKNVAGRKSANHQNVSKQHSKSHESGTEEGAEDLENMEPPVNNSANGGGPVDKLVHRDAKNRNKSSFSNVDNIEEDTSISMPSETIPLAPDLMIPPRNMDSFLSKSNRPRAQKNITDFFPSKFLQRPDNSKMLDSSASFDKEKLDLMKKELEAKRQQMRSLRIEESSKKKEIAKLRPANATKATKLRAKENAPKEPAKPLKVVDKAYIVNGQVYKRPKLPRPKPWVTDRLYRHLWKRLEPKYNLKTRIKSERFVEQLAEVVALTIRRKKYDSYKLEVDALMKEMARLNIVKTRNDFYDFCYDFLPYDFRVKVTPMVLPGGLSGTSTGWFAGLIPSEHVSALPEILPETDALNDAAVATEVDNKVKTKLLSMWNNVKYGWASKMKTNFSKESPVWLLGSCYHKKPEDSLERASEAVGLDMETGSEVSLAVDAVNLDEGMEGFKRDFVSRLWLTYRKEFPILNGSSFTSDCGWGCMLRSGQMMLAQALVCHFLGRDWRWQPEQRIETHQQFMEESKHRMIIKWFGDQPTPHSPLSIHSLVSLGASTGKRAGDWYGPAAVAHLLSQAVKIAASAHNEFENLAVYVAQDCAVYLDDVRSACETSDGGWRSLVIFVPLRLGADKLNPGYAPCLTSLLSLDVCIGVIGGRPRHSLYFIGYQEDKLIHLDPHYCQEAVDVWKHNFSLASFHCSSPRKMLLSKMDPSCCVGFYLHDKRAFDSFIKIVEPFLVPPNQKVDYPMFLFCEGSGDDLRRGYEVGEGMLTSSTSSSVGHDTLEDEAHYECEEFEIV